MQLLKSTSSKCACSVLRMLTAMRVRIRAERIEYRIIQPSQLPLMKNVFKQSALPFSPVKVYYNKQLPAYIAAVRSPLPYRPLHSTNTGSRRFFFKHVLSPFEYWPPALKCEAGLMKLAKRSFSLIKALSYLAYADSLAPCNGLFQCRCRATACPSSPRLPYP